jgi:hypothetical protein
LAITSIVTGIDPAEVTDGDPAEAASGVAIQIVNADSNAPAARTAGRKRCRCRANDSSAAGLSSASLG